MNINHVAGLAYAVTSYLLMAIAALALGAHGALLLIILSVGLAYAFQVAQEADNLFAPFFAWASQICWAAAFAVLLTYHFMRV